MATEASETSIIAQLNADIKALKQEVEDTTATNNSLQRHIVSQGETIRNDAATIRQLEGQLRTANAAGTESQRLLEEARLQLQQQGATIATLTRQLEELRNPNLLTDGRIDLLSRSLWGTPDEIALEIARAEGVLDPNVHQRILQRVSAILPQGRVADVNFIYATYALPALTAHLSAARPQGYSDQDIMALLNIPPLPPSTQQKLLELIRIKHPEYSPQEFPSVEIASEVITLLHSDPQNAFNPPSGFTMPLTGRAALKNIYHGGARTGHQMNTAISAFNSKHKPVVFQGRKIPLNELDKDPLYASRPAETMEKVKRTLVVGIQAQILEALKISQTQFSQNHHISPEAIEYVCLQLGFHPRLAQALALTHLTMHTHPGYNQDGNFYSGEPSTAPLYTITFDRLKDLFSQSGPKYAQEFLTSLLDYHKSFNDFWCQSSDDIASLPSNTKLGNFIAGFGKLKSLVSHRS